MKTFGRKLQLVSSSQETGAAAKSMPPSPPPPSVMYREAEPSLAATGTAEGLLLERLRTQVLERVNAALAEGLPADQLRAQIGGIVHELAGRDRLQLSARDQGRLVDELVDEMIGFGPLEVLLRDPRVDDIMVNGPNRVFVEVKGRLLPSDVRFRDGYQLASIAQRMAATVGRRVDESSPLVDCRLPDGSRVNIVFPPLAIDGVSISIRKFSRRRYNLDSLVENGSFTAPVARVLEVAARCRLNVVISGGTGSGKTTLLNAMSSLIDHGERIVTIEDAAELQLQQPHVVRLETRPPNLEGEGQVTMRDLVKNCLRMRPERIIVGEVRGPEAFDLLQAMNTGHDGSMGTLHANTPREALSRLESMITMGGYTLPSKTIREMICASVDVVIQAARLRDGSRRITHVTEVMGMEGDVIITQDVFVFDMVG